MLALSTPRVRPLHLTDGVRSRAPHVIAKRLVVAAASPASSAAAADISTFGATTIGRRVERMRWALEAAAKAWRMSPLTRGVPLFAAEEVLR